MSSDLRDNRTLIIDEDHNRSMVGSTRRFKKSQQAILLFLWAEEFLLAMTPTQ